MDATDSEPIEPDINTPKTVYDDWHVFIIQYGEQLVPFAYPRDKKNGIHSGVREGWGFVHCPFDEEGGLDNEDASRCEFREGMPCCTYEMEVSDARRQQYFPWVDGKQVRPPVDSAEPSTDEAVPRQYLQEMWRKT